MSKRLFRFIWKNNNNLPDWAMRREKEIDRLILFCACESAEKHFTLMED